MKDPGELNEKVQLLAPAVTQGVNGEAINTWGEYATRWCKVEPLGGSEITRLDIEMPAARCKFTFRYDANYTEKYRLVWNSQTWNVISITIVGKKEYIEMLAETNTSQTGDSTTYGDYYLTNSLKLRVIAGTLVTSAAATEANINSDVGKTATAAGAGYVCGITYTSGVYEKMLLVVSNGVTWDKYESLVTGMHSTAGTSYTSEVTIKWKNGDIQCLEINGDSPNIYFEAPASARPLTLILKKSGIDFVLPPDIKWSFDKGAVTQISRTYIVISLIWDGSYYYATYYHTD